MRACPLMLRFFDQFSYRISYFSYVRNKRDQKRQECADKSEEVEAEIAQLEKKLEAVRVVIKAMEKEINESGSSQAILRENIRVRKMVKEIKDTQAKIDGEDLDGAAKAKRNFEEKYNVYKTKETNLQTSVRTDDVNDLLFTHGSSSIHIWRASSVRTGANSKASRAT